MPRSASLPSGPSAPALWQTVAWEARPLAVLERCARRYGDMFTLRLSAAAEVVVVSDPRAVREVLGGDHDVILAGEANAILEPLVGSSSVLLLDGAAHVRTRRLLLPPFHGQRLAERDAVVSAIARREVARWPIGRPIEMRPRLEVIALEVIMRTLFGAAGAQRLSGLERALRRLLGLGRRRLVLLALPALARYRGPGGPRRAFDEEVAALDAMLLAEIERRRSEPASPTGGDVLTMLLEARAEDAAPLTAAAVRDHLITLIVAGHETTTTALAWSLERVVRDRRVLARLEVEVEAGREEYLEAFVMEALRLRPVVHLLMRRLAGPQRVAGRWLPAGTYVAPSIDLVHRRTDLYPEPASLRPERFLGHRPGTYEWLPFGAGARRCIGASAAVTDMKAVLRAILSEVRLCPTAEAAERRTRRSITTSPANQATVTLERGRRPLAGDSWRSGL